MPRGVFMLREVSKGSSGAAILRVWPNTGLSGAARTAAFRIAGPIRTLSFMRPVRNQAPGESPATLRGIMLRWEEGTILRARPTGSFADRMHKAVGRR